ncbi:MAG: hypothetical protein ACYCQK_02025 [Acidiferrobacteraceae bacterium]
MSRTPGCVHGRLPAEPVALGDLTHYLTEPLPAPPAEVTAPQLTYPMACNAQEGDCTIAAAVHTDQATANLTGEPWTYPGDPAVNSVYRQMTGGADTGLAETRVLRAWSAPGGLFGRRLAAWAPVAVKHLTTIKQTVWLCGAVYTGVLLAAPAQQQFAAGQPWGLTGTSADSQIEGGHAVPAVGYNALGPVFVTWGALQQATWAWWVAYSEEAYAVLTSEVRARGQLRGVDFARLDADLAAL